MNELKNLKASMSQPILQPTSPQKCTTYAEVVKSPPSTLVIRSNSNNCNAQEMAKTLESLDCPKDVKVTKLKVICEAIEIRCATEESKEKLKTYLATNALRKINASVEDKKPTTTKIIIFNVPCETDLNNVLAAILIKGKQERDLCSIITRIPSKRAKTEHWVLAIPRREAKHVLENNIFFIGLKKFYVRRYVRVRRCYKCQVLGNHVSSTCPNTKHCMYCDEEHEEEACTSKRLRCANCLDHNIKLKKDRRDNFCNEDLLPVSHSANDPCCPTFRRILWERQSGNVAAQV